MKKIFLILLTFLLITACTPSEQGTVKEQGSQQSTAENQKTSANNQQANSQTISAKKLLANKDARIAISLALDKKEITEGILANGAEAINFLVPKGLKFEGEEFRTKYDMGWYDFDAVAAKQFWAKAKSELKFQEVELSFLTYDDDLSLLLSENIKSQLESRLLGLKIKLNPRNFKEKIKLSEEADFDIELAGWVPDYPDPMTYLDLWHSSSPYNSGFSSNDYDQVINDCKYGDLARRYNQRWQAMQEAEKQLLEEEVALLPLFQSAICYLANPAVKGLVFHDFGADCSYQSAVTSVQTDGKYMIRRAVSNDIPTLDNSLASSDIAFTVLSNVLEGLVKLDDKGETILAGAESYTVSDDGLVYVFKLKEAAVWSNSEPVTAHDYVYSWQRLANPEQVMPYRFLLKTALIKNAEAVLNGELELSELGIKALDDYTLEVSLENPSPYFLDLLFLPSFYPINENFASEQGENFASGVDSMLFNGAYRLVSWQKGYSYRLLKSETYYDRDKVLNDGVSYLVIKDMAERLHQYEVGNIDFVGLNSDYVEQYQDHPDLKKGTSLSVYYLMFNLNTEGE